MKFEIYNRWTGAVQFTAEIECADDTPISIKMGIAVKWGFANGACLVRARLDGACLEGARLVRARLDGASLEGARLDGACLDGARLVRARLDGASLDGACLVRARLDGACLVRACLVRARLDGACLDGARLDGARLDGASFDGAILNGRKIKDAFTLGYPNGWGAFTYLTQEGEQRVRVGCRDKTLAEGRAYWANKDRRREVLAVLDYAEAIGRVRGWVK